jgi:predicted transposase YbfD/YdcC
MTNILRTGLDEVVAHFHELEDPRSTINRQHPLVSVVVIALMAVLAGAGGPTAIAKWAKMKEEWLCQILNLPHGIPRKDVFRRVLGLLKPMAFQACFANWLGSLRAKAAADHEVDQPILAVDGKTARRSHDRANGLGALHSVTVWASEFGLSLGQVACAEKSNEITAIPELLRLVDIKGAIITIDAMGTQKAIAAQIIDQEADFVLAPKGNQETLHQAVIDHLDKQFQNDFADVAARRHVTTEKGHGRQEIRSYIQMPAPADLPGFELWKGLATIGVVVSACVRDGKETVETRYYISSLEMGVKRFAHAVRSHWGIENGCHWSLDFTFREDESRIRDLQLRENFAWLNRLILSLLKQHPAKDSIVMKRRACGWSDDFLLTGEQGSALWSRWFCACLSSLAPKTRLPWMPEPTNMTEPTDQWSLPLPLL